MSSLIDIIKSRDDLLTTIGKAALNARYPDEFELYIIALELIDSSGKTLQYFIFPVNPSSFDDTRNEITNVKKTLGGVSVLSTTTFVPGDVNLSGNFGRSFKILVNGNLIDLQNSFSNTPEKEAFSPNIKTGYGCCKILQKIVDQAKQVDSTGGTHTLIFHNLALGNSYVVKPMNLRFNMSQESNMVWNYTLPLKTIAPLEVLYSAKQLQQQNLQLILNGFLQTQLNNVVNSLTSTLKNLPLS